MDDIKRQIVSVFESCADHKVHEWGVIKNKVKDDLGKLLYDRTRRTPMILPIIMESKPGKGEYASSVALKRCAAKSHRAGSPRRFRSLVGSRFATTLWKGGRRF